MNNDLEQCDKNSFTDSELEGMAHGNNPVANAYRELLKFRRVAGQRGLTLDLRKATQEDINRLNDAIRNDVGARMIVETGPIPPLDYLHGHADGLEWAARTAEACNPLTSDWLYDEPEALAAAIRKGPEMPPAHTEVNSPVIPDGWIAIPEDMLADYRDVKNAEVENFKASYASHCYIPGSRWQRDLADLTEELAEIDKLLVAAPKPKK